MKLTVVPTLLALVGCQFAPTSPAEATETNPPPALAETPDPAVTEPASPAPLDAEGLHSTALEYLLATYDANGDGSIARSEYTRSDQAFESHDHDEDGAITELDFDPELNAERKRRERAKVRAMPLVVWGFQADEEPEHLERTEFEQAFASYDEDGDGDIGTSEFEARWTEQRELGLAPTGPRLRMVERGDPWDALLSAADLDDDGRVTDVEMLTWFDSAAGPDGDLAALAAGSNARSKEGAALATTGAPAPDFTLPTTDGTEWITLSSFRHERPVALIFGSYT